MKLTTPTMVFVAAALAAVIFAVVMLMQPEQAPPAKVIAEPNLFPFVRSLEGTGPDGNIAAAAGNAEVANAELVRLFDYYLSAAGEKPLDAIRAEIEHELDQRLKPDAAIEARRLLRCYLDYKRDLVDVEKSAQAVGGSVQAIRARFSAMQVARRRYFSEREIQTMFGAADAYDMDAIARLEISQDTTLSAEQKRDRLAALDAAMPPAMREERQAPYKIATLEESAQKMREQGASDDDIYRMRAAALSPEAAARMADVDQEERAWHARIAAYLAERARLLAESRNLSAPDRQAALAQLRQSRFTFDEQKRLAAYEPADGG
jgi:lipase chaperone LimK